MGRKAQADHNRLVDLRNRISRDVGSAWLNANTDYVRLGVTQQLLDQSNLALDLANTRYRLGLSSIVELRQAQRQHKSAMLRPVTTTGLRWQSSNIKPVGY